MGEGRGRQNGVAWRTLTGGVIGRKESLGKISIMRKEGGLRD